MKNKIILPLIILVLAAALPSCSGFVENISPLIDRVEDVRLNDATQAQFVLRGVKGAFFRMWTDENPGTALMGDVGVFDTRVHQSVFTQNEDQTLGTYVFRSNENKYSEYHEARFSAIEMLRRIPLMLDTGTIGDQLLKDMMFWGNFVKGYSELTSAERFGLNINGQKPGNVISPDPFSGDEFGDFYSTSKLLGELAIVSLTEALKFSPSAGDGLEDAAYAHRMVNSFIARAHLMNYTGAYGTAGAMPVYINAAAAVTAANAGLVAGDSPFELIVGPGFTNRYWQDMGRPDNHQHNIDSRFARYILADPKEGEIVNNFRNSDVDVLTNFAAAVISGSTSDANYPVYDLSAGFSLATIPASGAVNVHGVAVPAGARLEGEPGNRGNFNADNPRQGESGRLGLTGTQTARIQLRESFSGPTFMDAYRSDGFWRYAPGIQARPDQLATAYGQDKYNIREQNIVLIDWQEMNLIKAEVLISTGDMQGALDLINVNRASHNLDVVLLADMLAFDQPWSGAYDITGALGFLIVERDKELFLRSTRMYDQFRFGIFHLPIGTDWPYFPIPQGEIDTNPKILPSR